METVGSIRVDGLSPGTAIVIGPGDLRLTSSAAAGSNSPRSSVSREKTNKTYKRAYILSPKSLDIRSPVSRS
jgi:hypothetical protein